MKTICKWILFTVLFAVFDNTASGQVYSIFLNGSYTTSSKIYCNPFDPDEYIRNQSFPVDNILGFGIEIRRKIESLGLQIGLSSEYLKKTNIFIEPINSGFTIPVEDGFRIIPVELTAYFELPFSSEFIQLYIGGGGGTYLGNRIYKKAGITAQSVDRKLGFGIHVQSGLQIKLSDFFSLRTDLKFRDIQIECTNTFKESSSYYHGMTVPLNQQPFSSKVNIDGITFSLGIIMSY